MWHRTQCTENLFNEKKFTPLYPVPPAHAPASVCITPLLVKLGSWFPAAKNIMRLRFCTRVHIILQGCLQPKKDPQIHLYLKFGRERIRFCTRVYIILQGCLPPKHSLARGLEEHRESHDFYKESSGKEKDLNGVRPSVRSVRPSGPSGPSGPYLLSSYVGLLV